MMSYEVKQALNHTVKQIDEKVKQLEEALGAKSAKTYDEYCVMCGEITGLLTARRYITDLTKKAENFDE
jgi:predicted mannosyl-3-phosphoglycerate phosphatase (HAD superfamily)